MQQSPKSCRRSGLPGSPAPATVHNPHPDQLPMSDLSAAAENTSTAAADASTGDPQEVPMVLISQEQRNALIDYLAKMPYQDVAAGISFLREAPVVNVTISMPNET